MKLKKKEREKSEGMGASLRKRWSRTFCLYCARDGAAGDPRVTRKEDMETVRLSCASSGRVRKSCILCGRFLYVCLPRLACLFHSICPLDLRCIQNCSFCRGSLRALVVLQISLCFLLFFILGFLQLCIHIVFDAFFFFYAT